MINRSIVRVIGPSISYVPLTQGQFSVVDSDIGEYLCEHNWFAGLMYSEYRAVRGQSVNGTRRTIYLHHEIISPLSGLMVDHKNGRTLDNRRANLRIVSALENARNCKRSKRNSSGIKGVQWYKRGNKWRSEIRVNGKGVFLGYHSTSESAQKAYEDAARHYFGEFWRA